MVSPWKYQTSLFYLCVDKFFFPLRPFDGRDAHWNCAVSLERLPMHHNRSTVCRVEYYSFDWPNEGKSVQNYCPRSQLKGLSLKSTWRVLNNKFKLANKLIITESNTRILSPLLPLLTAQWSASSPFKEKINQCKSVKDQKKKRIKNPKTLLTFTITFPEISIELFNQCSADPVIALGSCTVYHTLSSKINRIYKAT